MITIVSDCYDKKEQIIFIKGIKELKRMSRELYGKQETTHKQLRSEYSRLAKRYKTDPRNVIVDYLPPPTTQQAPIPQADTLTPQQEAANFRNQHLRY